MTFRTYEVTYETKTSVGRLVGTMLLRRTSQREAIASFRELYRAKLEKELGSPVRVLGASRA